MILTDVQTFWDMLWVSSPDLKAESLHGSLPASYPPRLIRLARSICARTMCRSRTARIAKAKLGKMVVGGNERVWTSEEHQNRLVMKMQQHHSYPMRKAAASKNGITFTCLLICHEIPQYEYVLLCLFHQQTHPLSSNIWVPFRVPALNQTWRSDLWAC